MRQLPQASTATAPPGHAAPPRRVSRYKNEENNFMRREHARTVEAWKLAARAGGATRQRRTEPSRRAGTAMQQWKSLQRCMGLSNAHV